MFEMFEKLDNSKKLKSMTSEEKYLSDKEEFDRVRIEIADKLEKALFPSFERELLEDKEWQTCFIITCRNIGKTYNVSLVMFVYMLRGNLHATALRKYKTHAKKSIAKTFSESLRQALGREYEEYFSFGKEAIRFIVGSLSLVLSIEGVADPDSFKGTEDKLIWIDEMQQLYKEDFAKIMGSIRSVGNYHKVILTSNIPVEGKKSWLYKEFVEPQEKGEQKKGVKYVSLSFEDNPFMFPDSEAIEAWRKSQRPYYNGRAGAFSREIDGVWLECSEYNIIKKWRVIENPTLKANILVCLYESGTYFTLGICMRGTQMAIVSESYLLPKQVEETQMILYHGMIERIIERNYTLYSRSLSTEKTTLEGLSSFFATRELMIESRCKESLREIEIASFDVSDDDVYLLDKPLSKNSQGFVIRALQVFVGWVY